MFEIALAFAPLVAGVVGGVKLLDSEPYRHYAYYSFTAGALSFVVLAWRAVVRNRKAQGAAALHALDGALHALHAILENGDGNSGLRICVFVPHHKKKDTCHQITNYVGGDGGGKGRDHSCRCGVVGSAFRSTECQFDTLPKNTQVVDHLVREHGFDRQEAATMRQDRRSWAAMPVGDPVVAVIFLDSVIGDFFGKSKGTRRRIIESSAIGVAAFMRKA